MALTATFSNDTLESVSSEPQALRTFRSHDGTLIAYERTGHGPPLVFVHGGWADHTTWSLVLPALAQHFTVYAMDRRGCGQSGPYGDDYSVERDFQDVASAVDMVGEPVVLVGHSIGGCFALHEIGRAHV